MITWLTSLTHSFLEWNDASECEYSCAAYTRVFIFYQHIKYHIFNMLKIKCDINQQDLKRVDLHFVKSE